MAIKIRLRRFVALLLCCVLVGSSFARSAYATDPVTAASLAITGGQLAGAGLSGEAALSLAGPVGAVVGVTLGALGINAYVSKAAQEAGKTRTRFVLDKLVVWGAQAGYTSEQLLNRIAEGISVAADGTIQLGADAAKVIQQFGSWLFTQDGAVVESVSSTSGSTVALGSYNLPFMTTYSFNNNPSYPYNYKYIIISSTAVAMGLFYTSNLNGNYTPGLISNESFTLIREGYYADGSLMETRNFQAQKSGNYYYWANQNFPLSRYDDPVSLPVINMSMSQFLGSLDGSWTVTQPNATDEVFTGTPEAWAENKDVLNPSADDTPVTLNPDLLNPIIDSLADGQQATMSIIDYLQALQDAWDHALDDVQTAIGTITDTLTGIQEQIAVPQDAVANPTVTNPSVTPDTTPILNPSDIDPGTVVTGLSFDLTQIFPFCIPFDIYDMLATLSATPEAPVYHVHYEGPYNIVIDFTVDLTPWDSVAAVLRTVELLAFCIGLAYVTRSMFIRS